MKNNFEMKNCLKVFKYIDPLFLYIVVIYGLSQIYQWLYDVESVWQTFWEKIQDLLGKIVDNVEKSFVNERTKIEAQ
jgi:hypothetical protein